MYLISKEYGNKKKVPIELTLLLCSQKIKFHTLKKESYSNNQGVSKVMELSYQFQGWFHGHGVYTTIDGMKYEGILFLRILFE